MTLEEFHDKLEENRKESDPEDYYERLCHCVLLLEKDGKDHRFEVRGWRPLEDGKLNISVVNWTLCAGAASLTLSADNVEEFRIEENE